MLIPPDEWLVPLAVAALAYLMRPRPRRALYFDDVRVLLEACAAIVLLALGALAWVWLR